MVINMQINHTGSEFGNYDISVESKEIAEKNSKQVLLLNGKYEVSLENDINKYTANLPGSLDISEIGELNLDKTIDSLVRRRKYIGKAYYRKIIQIPESFRDKYIELELERVIWLSAVYVDGRLVGSYDSLCTAHRYNLSEYLTPGEHELTIMIDNSARSGASCHGYGDSIQIEWNGVDGRIALTAYEKVFVKQLKVYPDISKRRIQAEAVIINYSHSACVTTAELTITPKDSSEIIGKQIAYLETAAEKNILKTIVYFSDNIIEWNEFNPYLYEFHCNIETEIDNTIIFDKKTIVFGMREFSHDSENFYLNGNKVWLRGTHDGGGFPLTGMTSCDKEEWRRIYRICKSYGLNHVRWHSFCPPEAAFAAADEEGIILQAELPFWGNVANGWAGTSFLYNELERILDSYGNHPSFCLFSMGNEHSGDWDVLANMVDTAKRYDNRHLYTAASNQYIRPDNGSVPGNPGDEFACNMWGMWGLEPKDGSFKRRIRYFERFSDCSEMAEADKDYDFELDGMDITVIAHELGQWWIYPDYDVMDKFTGILEPRNYSVLKEKAEEKGILKQYKEYSKCSGKLATILYKEDIEKQLRTKRMAGFQLLDLHDYWGQGTALVGILDAFWETKGLITPEAFRRFCNHTVVLSRIKKFTYFSDETLEIPFEVYRYEKSDLCNVSPEVTVSNSNGDIVYNEKFSNVDIKNRENTVIGKLKLSLSKINEPHELKITLKLNPYEFENDWNVWVYPKISEIHEEKVFITEEINNTTNEMLKKGKNVLLLNYKNPNSTAVGFSNAGWTPFIAGRDTNGLVINNKHPIFSDFPTEEYSNWQWQSLLNNARGIIVDSNINPIVEAIDGPFEAFRIGILTEIKVENATVIICSLNLNSETPEAIQLKRAIINYLSGITQPKQELTYKEFIKIIEPGRYEVTENPDLSGAVMIINASAKKSENGLFAWKKDYDDIEKCLSGYDYAMCNPMNEISKRGQYSPLVSCVKPDIKGWNGSNAEIRISLHDKFNGKIYLHLENHDGNLRYFAVSTEYDEFLVEKTRESKWLSISVSPLDIKDGIFKIRLNKQRAWYIDDTLMITQMILKED